MTRGDQPAIAGGEPIRAEPLGYGGQSIGRAEKDAVLEVLDSEYVTRGPRVEEFESRVAEFLDVDHAVATTSGTTALHLAGEAVGFGPGDEVITTPLTFVATAHAASHAGAIPVLADVDPERRTLDPWEVERQITDDTAGIVPMHYAGHPADIEGLLGVADDHDLRVVWDACHAFGGTWHGRPIGAQPDVAVFSFHPVKNLTTAEGGMVVTDDATIAERARRLRSFDMDYDPVDHEDEPWYQVAEGVGYNYNVTELQAALGLAQLDRLDAFKRRRTEIIERYDEALADVQGIVTPPSAEGVDADPMYHLYAVEVDEGGFGWSRREFVEAMHEENVFVQVHYVPLNYHPLFQRRFDYREGDFPKAERLYDRLVSLPLFPGMTDEDADDVIAAIERIHDHRARI